MRVLFVGLGVIGTIYGWALSEAGVSVTHAVRPFRRGVYAQGIDLDVLDLRDGRPTHAQPRYQPNVVGSDEVADDYDLVVIATKHYQAADTVAQFKDAVPSANVLMFCGNWDGSRAIDALIPRSRYAWGYAASTGGVGKNAAVLNIRSAFRFGPVAGSPQSLSDSVVAMFGEAGFEADMKPDIVEWLWVHHAINAGMIGTAIAAGGIAEMGASDANMERMIYAVRDALGVLAARGVEISRWPDTTPFLEAPIQDTIANTRDAFITSEWGRRVADSGHFGTNPEEMRRFVTDVVSTGHELGVEMPTLGSLLD